jgi:hypothetical protein
VIIAMKNKCIVVGCDAKEYAAKLCEQHYQEAFQKNKYNINKMFNFGVGKL